MKQNIDDLSIGRLLYLAVRKCVRIAVRKCKKLAVKAFRKKNSLIIHGIIPDDGSVFSVKIPDEFVAYISGNGTLNVRKRLN